MTYRVVLSPSVEVAIDAHIDYIAKVRQEPNNASRVLTRLYEALDRLDTFPNAAPFARENEHRDYPIRMTVVAGCRLLFTVDEVARSVHVIGFRHGGQASAPHDLPEKRPHD